MEGQQWCGVSKVGLLIRLLVLFVVETFVLMWQQKGMHQHHVKVRKPSPLFVLDPELALSGQKNSSSSWRKCVGLRGDVGARQCEYYQVKIRRWRIDGL